MTANCFVAAHQVSGWCAETWCCKYGHSLIVNLLLIDCIIVFFYIIMITKKADIKCIIQLFFHCKHNTFIDSNTLHSTYIECIKSSSCANPAYRNNNSFFNLTHTYTHDSRLTEHKLYSIHCTFSQLLQTKLMQHEIINNTLTWEQM